MGNANRAATGQVAGYLPQLPERRATSDVPVNDTYAGVTMDIHLDSLRVAAPCTADWNSMRGDDRIRHCELCKLNVYNISAMTRQEAETLVREAEGRLCVSMFRRSDGTVITSDCPIGLRGLRDRAWRRICTIAGAVVALVTGGFAVGNERVPNEVAPADVPMTEDLLRRMSRLTNCGSDDGYAVLGDCFMPSSVDILVVSGPDYVDDTESNVRTMPPKPGSQGPSLE